MPKGNNERWTEIQVWLAHELRSRRPCLGFGCGVNGKGKKLTAADGWRGAGGTAVERGDDGGESLLALAR